MRNIETLKADFCIIQESAFANERGIHLKQTPYESKNHLINVDIYPYMV